MKFVRDLIVFAVTFLATYLLVTYLFDKGITSQNFFNAVCYTIGGTIGYGLITYFQQKKKKENK